MVKNFGPKREADFKKGPNKEFSSICLGAPSFWPSELAASIGNEANYASGLVQMYRWRRSPKYMIVT